MEYLYLNTPDESCGVFEIIPLLGGWESNTIIPSLNVLMGFRTPFGLEFGFGPNYSLTDAGFVAAVGYTFKLGYINVPINFAYYFSRNHQRFAIPGGFNSRAYEQGEVYYYHK